MMNAQVWQGSLSSTNCFCYLSQGLMCSRRMSIGQIHRVSLVLQREASRVRGAWTSGICRCHFRLCAKAFQSVGIFNRDAATTFEMFPKGEGGMGYYVWGSVHVLLG